MKRTSPAKIRLKANVIKNKFQEDPSMRLPSRLIWRFCRHFLKLILSNHLSNLLPTLISRIFSTTFQNKQTQIFFCQIIMGSPLNSNVPEGRSVQTSNWSRTFFAVSYSKPALGVCFVFYDSPFINNTSSNFIFCFKSQKCVRWGLL